jgi:hypothetical protein
MADVREIRRDVTEIKGDLAYIKGKFEAANDTDVSVRINPRWRKVAAALLAALLALLGGGVGGAVSRQPPEPQQIEAPE